jgi:general secretion pathway protein G
MQSGFPSVPERGFTMIEMVIVISLILILVSVSAPIYTQVIWRAKGAVLRQDLFILRSLVSQYTLDKRTPPASLMDLVDARYLKRIPVDPFTGRSDTWVLVREEDGDPTQPEPRISDVQSGSDNQQAKSLDE